MNSPYAGLPAEAAPSLATALLQSSEQPMLLLDRDLTVIDASASFVLAFDLRQAKLAGRPLASLSGGAWNRPQLLSLLRLTADGNAAVDAYELDYGPSGPARRRLVVRAVKLDYGDAQAVRIVVTATDVTFARLADKLRDDVVREKNLLLQELQHRVANSLQIIASVLMQSVKRVQSEESRGHLRDAHNRVMSIAAVQRQLATTRLGEVALEPYFAGLCQSIGASMIAEDRIALTSNVDGSSVKAEDSVSLGLIVTELVINALKHGFPGEASGGRIVVDYRTTGANWSLSVADNGVGMKGDHTDAKPGLGTGIVDALSKNLDAVVTVSDEGPGTRVLVSHTG